MVAWNLDRIDGRSGHQGGIRIDGRFLWHFGNVHSARLSVLSEFEFNAGLGRILRDCGYVLLCDRHHAAGSVQLCTQYDDPPACLAYPFVAGLRFFPIPILIAVMLVCLAFGDVGFAHRPRFRYAYLLLGMLLLLVVPIAGVSTSGANRIWQAGLSIRWTLLAGESFVLSVNIALFLFGYHFFNRTSMRNNRQLLSWARVADQLIHFTPAIVYRHSNQIEK